MFQQQNKKKPPPRPPPPNFSKYKSKSTFNLTQPTPNLIEWSPPSSPKPERPRQFGGSVSSSYSSSASSLASSKKSLENDATYFTFMQTTLNWTSNNNNVQSGSSMSKPRIIRAPPPKKSPIASARQTKDTPAESDSPPMPTVPPPSPPKEQCEVVTPYGIALYDFPASQPGDLALQADDVVILLRRVNNDWLYGRVCEREGIFPDNFVQIEVPLPGEHQTVTAMFEFAPQVQGDLALKPGQKIRVIKKISNEWLYGCLSIIDL